MKQILILLLATLVLCSCGKKTLFEETRTFANDTWMRFEPEKYDITATTTEDCYDIYVTMQIDTCRYHATGLPLAINLYSNDGERRMFSTTMVLRDVQGSWKGTFEGSTLTLTKNIRPYFFFNKKGSYRLELSQMTHYYEIKGIKSLTVKFVKSELEYPE